MNETMNDWYLEGVCGLYRAGRSSFREVKKNNRILSYFLNTLQSMSW